MAYSSRRSRTIVAHSNPAQAPSDVPSTNPTVGLSAQEYLGNTALRGDDPIARMVHGAELLRAAGVCGVPTPGDIPMSAMRALMLSSQAAEEGLDTGAAAGAIRRSSGAPLPDAIRKRLESAFSHDFSHVRIHTDGAAAEAAMDLNALAFTLGTEVFFGAGMFAPSAPSGLELLAHELTHVIQHDEGRLQDTKGSDIEVSSPEDSHEREAVRVGAAISHSILSESDSSIGIEEGESQEDLPMPEPTAAVAQEVGGTSHVGGDSLTAETDSNSPSNADGLGVVSRFASFEHIWIGDRVAQGLQGTVVDQIEVGPGLRIGFGEVIALAGDYFDSPWQLFWMGQNPGRGPGTQGEIHYALHKMYSEAHEHVWSELVNSGNPNNVAKSVDPDGKRLASHGPATSLTTSRRVMVPRWTPEAEEAVESRYRRLGCKNRDHFLKGTDALHFGSSSTGVGSARAGYQRFHGAAISLSLLSHQFRDTPVTKSLETMALINEGFAVHFLTDSFSAGHMRVPEGEIDDYWSALAPNFREQVIDWLVFQPNVLNTTIGCAGGVLFGILGAELALSLVVGETRQQLNRKIPKEFGLGDVVGGILHDFDSIHGVAVNSGGSMAMYYGDGNLFRNEDQQDAVVFATQLSMGEVLDALSRGVTPGNQAGSYSAELLMPTACEPLDPQSWKAESVEALINDKTFASMLKDKAVIEHLISSLEGRTRVERWVTAPLIDGLRADALRTLADILGVELHSGDDE